MGVSPTLDRVKITQELDLQDAAVINGDGNDISTQLKDLDSISTAEFGYVDAVTPGTAAANKAVVLGASKEIATITSATITTLTTTTITSAALVLNSTAAMTLQIGGVGAVGIDDAAITIAAAADTAGQPVYIASQAGGVDTAVDGGSAGGLLNIATGAGSAGGAAQTGGAGGALSFISGVGGTPASGSASGGAGGLTIVGSGAGGAAGAGGGTGGDGGSVRINPGAAGGAGGGSAGVSGVVRLLGTIAQQQGTPTAKTAAATLTAAELLTRIITETDTTGATVAFTLPTGTNMDLALPAAFVAGDCFEFTIINLSAAVADTVTLTANTGFTIVGIALVESSHADAETISSATFRCRKTGSNVFVAYRIS